MTDIFKPHLNKKVQIKLRNGIRRVGKIVTAPDSRNFTGVYPYAFEYKGPSLLPSRGSDYNNMVVFTKFGEYYNGRTDDADVVEIVPLYSEPQALVQSSPNINLEAFNGKEVLIDFKNDFYGCKSVVGVISQVGGGLSNSPLFGIGGLKITKGGSVFMNNVYVASVSTIRENGTFSINRRPAPPAYVPDPKVEGAKNYLRGLNAAQLDELLNTMPEFKQLMAG